MRVIFPDKTSKKDFHQFMLGALSPRPIAFVSSTDKEGNENLAPFSYFNAISSNPPIIVFSVNRNANGSKKDTLINIEQTKECVINMVSFDISRQMAMTSIPFPNDTNEFTKSGLNPVPSTTIKPNGVLESPVRFECKLDRILYFGDNPSASSLIICNVTCIHIDENAINEKNRIDPLKLNLIGRLGRSYYQKITKESLFSIPPIKSKSPIGFDGLPKSIVKSKVLTGNEISKIAELESLPPKEKVKELFEHLKQHNLTAEQFHEFVKLELKNNNITAAATFALIPEYFFE